MWSSNRELSVFAEVLYDEENEEFIVGYGKFEDKADFVGVNESLGDAFKEVGENIDKFDNSKQQVRESIDRGEKTSLELRVMVDNDSIYHIVASDADGNEVRGSGRNITKAFVDLGVEITKVFK